MLEFKLGCYNQPPESPIIELIENSTANSPNADTPGTSNELNPTAPKLAPSATTEGTPTTAGIGSGGAEGPSTAV